MSTEADKNKPPLLGLFWLHEIPFLALIVWAFLRSDAAYRGTSWPLWYFGAAVLGGVVMLILRCREEWQAMPNKVFFVSLTTAWVALFCFLGNSTFGYAASPSIFTFVFDTYTSPESDSSHGLFIPFVVLGLLWWKRTELGVLKKETWWPAIFLVAAGLILHIVGYVVQQPRLSFGGFLVGVYGLTGMAWGRGWLKATFFPMFLLGFCMPTPPMDGITFKMRLLVSWIVEHIAHLGLAPDLVRVGTQLTDANHSFAYEVAAACSGIRSLMTLLALTTIYGFICFKSPWKRGVMILSAIPLSIAGNVLRLCFTIMVAEFGGQDAGKAVETKAGMVTFLVAIAGVYFLGRWLEKSEPKKTEDALP